MAGRRLTAVASSVLAAAGASGLGVEAFRLVPDGDGDAREGVGVLSAVMGTEEELTDRQFDANVRARAAPVAAVGCGQGRDKSCCHISM